jgi:hypothetical protein
VYSGRNGLGLREGLAGLPGRNVAVLLHEPLLVVLVLEHMQREPQVLDGIEGLDPKNLLLERADKALGNSVSLGFRDV